MTAQGEDILAWLTDAIGRREQTAIDALNHGRAATWIANRGTVKIAPELVRPLDDAFEETVVFNEGAPTEEQAQHIALHDPASVLRRCAADRKLLELHGGRMHSCPAKDETGYLDEWTEFAHGDTCPVVQLVAEGYGWTEGER